MRPGHHLSLIVIEILVAIAALGSPVSATAPSVSITSPIGLSSDPTPTLTYTASDGTVAVKVDGAIVQKVSGERLDTLADGQHTVRVEATNGQAETGSAEVLFTIDAAGPTTAAYTKVAAGSYHTLAIMSDGSLWAWGLNSYGKLGDGTTVHRSMPVSVATGSVWKAVAAGANHSLGIKADGALWAWGYNLSGQLGDGTGTTRTSPKKIGTDTDWVAVHAGNNHSLALKTDGSLWAWGDNAYGQLGNGTNDDSTVPVPISAAPGTVWLSASTTANFTIALKSDGTLWTWGYNAYGQLGDPSLANHNTPLQVGTETDWASALAGANHIVAIKNDGSAWAWGYNTYGQLGIGNTTQKTAPVQIGGINGEKTWIKVACGANHTLALKQNGTLWAWGYDVHGELGDGATTTAKSPKQIGDDISWTDIIGGTYYSVALKADGTMWIWGYNTYGAADRLTPVQVGTDTTWTSPAGGLNHSVALRSDGTLWAWGDNFYGQVGDGTVNQEPSPAQIGTEIDWMKIVAGSSHVAAIKLNGRLYTWGYNGHGRLGDGTNTTRKQPVWIGQEYTWIDVTAGAHHTAAIRSDGTLWAWGYNGYGQIGDGTTTNQSLPQQIGSGGDWIQVIAGDSHTVALKANGTLWAWGLNSSGQLGNGNTTRSLTPVQVGAATDWRFVATGSAYTMAIKTDGTLWGWGANTVGQLGNGSLTNKTSPTQIGTDTNWQAIGPGLQQTLALKNDGSLWAWGDNEYGEIGNGIKTAWTHPVRIKPELTWAHVGAGNFHSLAVASDGTLWTWGYNGFGQLGDGTVSQKLSPIQVEHSSVIRINNGAAVTNNAVVTLALVAVDANGVVEMQFSDDGASWSAPEPYAATKAWSLLSGDGVKTVWVKFKDNADNWSLSYPASIELKVIPPLGIVYINNEEASTNTTAVTLNLNAVGLSGISQMQFRNENGTWSTPAAYKTTKTWSLSAGDGTKTVYAKFKDSAGLWSDECSATIVLDTIAPVVTISSPVTGITDSTTPLLIYSVSDGAVIAQVDGNVVSKSTGSALDALAAGPHTVRIEAIDLAGNTSYAEVVFIVATAPPVVTISSPVSGSTNTNRPVLLYTVSSGTVSVKVDGISVLKTSGEALDLLSEGLHTVRVEAMNGAGLTGFAEVTFTVDTESPLSGKMPKIAKISAGENHSIAIAVDGRLWAWGSNWSGSLGDGTSVQNSSPELIGTDHDWSAIDAASSGTMALKSIGTLWAWGLNDNGQLGDGSFADKYAPIWIGTDNDWRTVSSGILHSAALKQNGTLWMWGLNSNGQLGDGTGIDTNVPIQVGTDGDWVAISVGEYHTVALKSDGTLWAWGANWSGQLGDGTTTEQYAPARIGMDNDWLAISAGAYYTIAIKFNGTLWAWGMNYYGQLGDGTTTDQYAPVQIGSAADWTEVSAGAYHTVARKSNGTLWAWGTNWFGQLGDGTTVDQSIPEQIGFAVDWLAVSAGTYHTMATKSDGTLWMWGYNAYGQLGDGTTQDNAMPQSTEYISGSTNALAINGGAMYTTSTAVTLSLYAWDMTDGVAFMRFSSDGTIWTASEPYATTRAWQFTEGDGQKTVYAMFQDTAGNWSSAISASIVVDTRTPIVTILSPAAGCTNIQTPLLSFTTNEGRVTAVLIDGADAYRTSGEHLAALTDGPHILRVVSENDTGNIGYAEVSFIVDTIKPLAGGFVQISAGSGHRLALHSDGTIWGQGWNDRGQLGNGSRADSTSFVPTIVSSGSWSAIYSFNSCSMAVKTDGSLWHWGHCVSGLRGEDGRYGSIRPIQIGSDHDWTKVLSGFAIKSSGTLWTWELNAEGQLVPLQAQVGGDEGWRAITRKEHTLGLKSSGGLWAWGQNGWGQLGIGITSFYEDPVLVDGVWSAVAAGSSHSVGIKSGGSLWAWGNNWDGALGDGTIEDRWSPVNIGDDNSWATVEAGDQYTIALKSNGTLWSWGTNQSGRLGRGDNISSEIYPGGWSWCSLSPVQIGADADWSAISAEYNHAIALKLDRSLWSWGQDGTVLQTGESTPINYYPVLLGGRVTIDNGTGYSHSSNVIINLNPFDANGVSEMQFSRDGVAWSDAEPFATTKAWTFDPGDGQRAVHVKFKDNAGNWSSVYRVSTVIDTVAPTVSMTSPVPGLTLDNRPLLAYTYSDGMVVVTVDGIVVDKVSGNLLDTLPDGDHIVRVTVMDASGWVNFAEVVFRVDAVAPTIAIISPAAEPTNKSAPMLTYTVSDGMVVVKVDGFMVNKVSGNTLDALADGVHTVRVESTDTFMRTGVSEVTFTVDTVAPTVSITSPASGFTNNATPTVVFSVSEGTAIVKADGATVGNYSGIMLVALTDGPHTVRVEATDAAGNTSFAQVVFIVNTTPGADLDIMNPVCEGAEKYLVGPSNFTSGIQLPMAGTNEVLIASPANFATIDGPKVIVKGAMDTTVPVNSVMIVVSNATGTAGYLAQVNGSYFAAKVPVSADTFSISAIATDQTGTQHQTSVMVSVSPQSGPVDLLASPGTGIPTPKESSPASLDVRLMSKPTITSPVISYVWDFDGSGSEDLTCYSHSDVIAIYQQTGLYLTKVAVNDSQGNTYSDTVIVNVVDRSQMDAVFKPIWNGMKTALASGDIDGSLNYVAPNSINNYRQIFASLGVDFVNERLANIIDLEISSVADRVVQCWAVQVWGTGTRAYPVTFIRDENGIWKILGF